MTTDFHKFGFLNSLWNLVMSSVKDISNFYCITNVGPALKEDETCYNYNRIYVKYMVTMFSRLRTIVF